MSEPVKVSIYGDSIMRGTVMGGEGRYHSTIGAFLQRLKERFNIIFQNQSHFGITVEKGSQLLHRDIAKGLESDFVLLEFGGNDCSFAWNEVSADPGRDHRPATEPAWFAAVLRDMVQSLQALGMAPVLMTLPPVDAARHLDYISRGGNNRENILAWLGDEQMIYRYHELYSSAVYHVAEDTGCMLADVRAAFLGRHDLNRLVGEDGVHLSREGYSLVCDVFADFIARRRAGRALTPLRA